MREDDAVVLGGPGEDSRVVCLRQAHILNANNVQVGPPAEPPSDGVALEVLVAQQPQHDPPSCAAPGLQSTPDVAQVALPTLDPALHLTGFLFSLGEVLLDIGSVTQVVRNHAV